MRCSVAAAAAGATCAQPSCAHTSPLASAASTHLAPWSTTCPAPSALCPTSELPMSPSLGSPTAVPCALRVRHREGAPARRASMHGVGAE
jgi:hypothetical protein